MWILVLTILNLLTQSRPSRLIDLPDTNEYDEDNINAFNRPPALQYPASVPPRDKIKHEPDATARRTLQYSEEENVEVMKPPYQSSLHSDKETRDEKTIELYNSPEEGKNQTSYEYKENKRRGPRYPSLEDTSSKELMEKLRGSSDDSQQHSQFNHNSRKYMPDSIHFRQHEPSGQDPYENEKDENIKKKLAMLVEQTMRDTEKKLQSVEELKSTNRDYAPYRIGFILSMVKKSRDMLNELFNTAVKHRDSWKALEQLKIFELIAHTNVDTTDLVRNLVEVHIQFLNSSSNGGQKLDTKRVVLLK